MGSHTPRLGAFALSSLATLVLLSACSSGGGGGTPAASSINQAPVVDAGNAITLYAGDSATLAGSATDSDGTIASYLWSQSAGTAATLSNATSSSLDLIAPQVTSATTLTLQLTATDDAGSTGSDSVTVQVLPLPTLSLSDSAITEADVGTQTTNLTVTLSSAMDRVVSFDYATLPGTASADSDYQSSTGTVTFNPGETSRTLPVVTFGDTLVEGDEQFSLSLSNPLNANLAQSSVTLTLVDTDKVVISAADAEVLEGDSGTTNLVFTLTLDQAANGPVSLRYDTSDDTTQAGVDYQNTGGTITFSGGQTSASVTVVVNGDTDLEGDEALLLELTSPSANATLGTSVAVGTIRNDDLPPLVLNDTGLYYGGNYPSGNNTGCSGETVARQDCSHGRDATHFDNSDGAAGFSYTKLDASGSPLAASASSWSCIRDNVTGYYWEAKSGRNGIVADTGLHDADDTYTWYNTDPSSNSGKSGYERATLINYRYDNATCDGYDSATPSSYCNTEAFVARVNAEALCGFNDWRVPSTKELESILNYAESNPPTERTFFPHTYLGNYWTSQRSPQNDNIFVVSFTLGGVGDDYGDARNSVRLVRSAP